MTEKPTRSREIILDVLTEVLENGAYSHLVLRRALEKYQYLPKQDRAFITRVCEGTIEWKLTLDAVLEQCSSVKVEKMKPVIRTVLRMSAYQILKLERVPDAAVVSEAVKLTAKRGLSGLKGYVNGVLRTVSRKKDSFVFTDWERRYSMPDWLIGLWKRQYGAAAVQAMLEAFLADAPTQVRCNTERAARGEVAESLRAQGVTVREHPLSPSMLLLSGYDCLEALDAFADGRITVQDASSSFVGEAAAPREGDFVMDVCGAPGGKALHAAQLLHGTGKVLVRDLTEEKIALVRENLERTGLSNVETEVWDARVPDARYRERADAVIADLPCSGLGVIGKKPEIKYQASPQTLAELAALQREILAAAVTYVRPGGRLIYSTCTVNPGENEEQRAWLLQNYPEFVPESLAGRFPSLSDEPSLAEGYIQFLPGKHLCDGFFLAAFRRAGRPGLSAEKESGENNGD